ncbi:hypothetical protein DL93DRAFT_2085708 [Clavulina sp. PMI_390]|nr:hypothetical protein DL93DRAFT_2085708 [Clavulina sp. PMI_390]
MDPDGSFTLDDLVGPEKGALLSSSPSSPMPEKDGALARPNGTATDDSYAARLDELLLEDDDDSDGGDATISSPRPLAHLALNGSRLSTGHDDEDENEEDDDDDEEGFVYTGEDAPEPASYDSKLAELLEADSATSAQEDSTDLNDDPSPSEPLSDARTPFTFPKIHAEMTSDESPPTSAARSPQPNTLTVPNSNDSPVRTPFLHPSVSRLRSFMPQHRPRVLSSSTMRSSVVSHMLSPEPSHLSALSRASSVAGAMDQPMMTATTLNGFASPGLPPMTPRAPSHSPTPSSSAALADAHQPPAPREVFRWTTLRTVSSQVYSASKAAAVLDTHMGRPTVIVAGGMVCVGSDTGRTYVFDFRQQFKFILGPDIDRDPGAVTALALSLDHTFLGVGHANGFIFLYDLAKPQIPVRRVEPVEFAQVASSRKEGHLYGSKITQLGFVGVRHTAIVSADDAGLAFYHSLGKVLFVEANDVIRILGNYPEDGPIHPVPPSRTPSSPSPSPPPTSGSQTPRPRRTRHPASASGFRFPLKRGKKSSTILAMGSLPIASSPHPTDAFNIIALLTPLKLVIVGLKPSPRTWFRRHRGQDDEDEDGQAMWRGCLAWFPSVSKSEKEKEREKLVLAASSSNTTITPSNAKESAKKKEAASSKKKGSHGNKIDIHDLKKPVLAYSWGRTIMFLRVRADRVLDAAAQGKGGESSSSSKETHALAFEEAGEVIAESDVMALQWLNDEQLLVVTTTHFSVYDLNTLKLVDSAPCKATNFASSLSHYAGAPLRPPAISDPGDSLAVSVNVYKGKIFVLGSDSIQVGTLISWADRILMHVERGDFLGAIDLTRTYYTGQALGNKAGLPISHSEMQVVVGQKLRELMTASANYAFSDDRMTDDTHYSLDGRGVDRTDLFEGLVLTTLRACAAMDDYDFVFEELFDMYDEHGIAGIYLTQLQSAILSGDLRTIPPRVSQRLVAYHDERGAFEMAEQIIWHIDPSCLDINQVIALCQKHDLYDALIYVYTRALRDYVSPLVELLGLLRKIRQSRTQKPARTVDESQAHLDRLAVERLVPNAYKVYSYLGDVLSGLIHPSQEPMPEDEAFQAKSDIYSFLFRGQSSIWQGKLIATADEENGPEHTFPYLRLLVRFDAEAALHCLDQAFEDSFLNESDSSISRQKIIGSLLELMKAVDLSSTDITFLRIFVARNVPKYPQFIRLPSKDVRSILLGLASDKDQSTREDRQLAAEILLSAYPLRDDAALLKSFEEAEFYRILRTFNLQEQRWAPLVTMYLRDDELPVDELFSGIEGVLSRFKRPGSVPDDLMDIMEESLTSLLEADVTRTAILMDRRLPALHDDAIAVLRLLSTSKELGYLWCLIKGPLTTLEDSSTPLPSLNVPSSNLSPTSRTRFVTLLCENDPSQVQATLSALPHDYFDLDDVIGECEAASVFDAVVWALNAKNDVENVFVKGDDIIQAQSALLASALTASTAEGSAEAWSVIERLGTLGRMLIKICSERSSASAPALALSADDMWFRLLSSQISAVQAVSSVLVDAGAIGERSTITNAMKSTDASGMTPLERLRLLVQDTFSSLVQQSSSKALSFPRLFKRLVDASSSAKYGRKTMYTEFRLILGGMLESYRAEEDVLLITKRLAEQDLFQDVAEYSAARRRGMRVRVDGGKLVGVDR